GWRAARSTATGVSRAPSSNRIWIETPRVANCARAGFIAGHNREAAAVESTLTLRDLFEEALKLPPDARARLLADGCADSAMRADLERMLAADAEDGEWLAA